MVRHAGKAHRGPAHFLATGGLPRSSRWGPLGGNPSPEIPDPTESPPRTNTARFVARRGAVQAPPSVWGRSGWRPATRMGVGWVRRVGARRSASSERHQQLWAAMIASIDLVADGRLDVMVSAARSRDRRSLDSSWPFRTGARVRHAPPGPRPARSETTSTLFAPMIDGRPCGGDQDRRRRRDDALRGRADGLDCDQVIALEFFAQAQDGAPAGQDAGVTTPST